MAWASSYMLVIAIVSNSGGVGIVDEQRLYTSKELCEAARDSAQIQSDSSVLFQCVKLPLKE